MKKVFLSAVALAIAGISYGQTPTAPSTPPPGATNLNPGGVGTDNKGDANQTGFDHKLSLYQVGTNNSSVTNQENGGDVIGNNKAVVSQVGALLPASGIENMAGINQAGTRNEATTDQRGDYNLVKVGQGQNDDLSKDNRALVEQGSGAGNAQSNQAEVIQDGTENWSFTKQTSDNNEALTTQEGDLNRSRVIQEGQPAGSVGHAAEVWQRGNQNEAAVLQYTGAGARNEATSIQLGDRNQSLQKQKNSAVSGGTMNNAFVSQGDPIESVLRSDLPGLYLDNASLDGDVLVGGLTGASNDADAIQDQDGTDNDAEIHQFGAAGPNYANQKQLGDSNIGLVVQNAFGGAGGDNTVYQEQIGNDNVASIIQKGSGNEAIQKQDSDWNFVLSTQNGIGNELNTRQHGGDDALNRARIHSTQMGDFNRGILEQYGNNSMTLVQNGSGNIAQTQQADATITPGVLDPYEAHTHASAGVTQTVAPISGAIWP